jgi:hypothetical protein
MASTTSTAKTIIQVLKEESFIARLTKEIIPEMVPDFESEMREIKTLSSLSKKPGVLLFDTLKSIIV